MTVNDGPRLLPLRPVEPDFVSTLTGVVAKDEVIRSIARHCVERGVTDIVFVGCGGSFSSSIHAATVFEASSRRFFVRNINAAEFRLQPPARLGATSLVIASSHSGGTPETLEAARFARQSGALVVAISRDDANPLADTGHWSLSYGSERTVTPAKQILLAQLVLALREAAGDAADFGRARAALAALPNALHRLQVATDPRLSEIARVLDGRRVTHVVASGPAFGAAFTLSLCYLMEMQWMPAQPIDAGDYVHGPFEMLTDDASLMVFLGEDATRPLTERILRFATRYGRHVCSLDSTEFMLDGVPDAERAFVAPIALGVLATRLADHLEAVRGHSLDDRRYMHKVEY